MSTPGRVLPNSSTCRIAAGQAKPYQLRQLVALVRRYDVRIEDDR